MPANGNILHYKGRHRFKYNVFEKYWHGMGLGGGQVVGVLSFYSDNLSSNLDTVYNFLCHT